MMFTVLPVPAFLSAKAPTEVFTVRTSPLISPVKAALAVFSMALVLASYSLPAAVIPVTALMVALVMSAVVVAESFASV